MDTLVKGGTLVTPAGIFRADLGIREGKIAAIAADLPSSNLQVVNAENAWVFPGGIDVHCHLPWPSKAIISGDDVLSGTRAAICGGVTSVIDFIIPELGETLQEATERKLAEADKGLFCDYTAHVCVREVNKENLKQIPALVEQGFVSFKIFMAYQSFQLEDQEILQVMDAVKKAGGIVSVHAENGLLADQATSLLIEAGNIAVSYYPESRPVYCEEEAIQRIITFAQSTKTPLHIHHVSSEAGARLIRDARFQGTDVTGETCPQYLFFNENTYYKEGLDGTILVIAPPLRKPSDQEALWKALSIGDLSIIATDHCPYTLQQKSAGIGDFTKVPGGSGGVETRWPTMFTASYVKGRLSLERLAAIWATNPGRRFGLYPQKGAIVIGADADLIIVKPKQNCRLSIKNLHMNTDHTAYEGVEVVGFPLTTMLRGKVVVEDGKAPDHPTGTIIRRRKERCPVI